MTAGEIVNYFIASEQRAKLLFSTIFNATQKALPEKGASVAALVRGKTEVNKGQKPKISCKGCHKCSFLSIFSTKHNYDVCIRWFDEY